MIGVSVPDAAATASDRHYSLASLIEHEFSPCLNTLLSCIGDTDCKAGKHTGSRFLPRRYQGSEQLLITQAPPFTVLKIGRFSADATGVMSRNNALIHFGKVVNVPCLDRLTMRSRVVRYKIVALILHQGGYEAGHYSSYILETNEGSASEPYRDWWHYDDARCRFMERDAASADVFMSPEGWDIRRDAYLLFCERQD